MNGRSAVLALFGVNGKKGQWQDLTVSHLATLCCRHRPQLTSLSDIPQRTALSVLEAVNVEDVARAVLASSLFAFASAPTGHARIEIQSNPSRRSQRNFGAFHSNLP